jgi:hypothetical protein
MPRAIVEEADTQDRCQRRAGLFYVANPTIQPLPLSLAQHGAEARDRLVRLGAVGTQLP